jgi:UbiD family decarboxylase
MAEGPYAEYTGYVGPQVVAPVFEVTAVTYRKDALYQDYALGLPDMLIPDNMAIEAKIYNIVSQVVPELINVHVPISGKRFHAYLQIDKVRPAIGKDAILAAKPCYPRLKHIFVMDKDVDIFDDSQVMWSIATRSQWDRDLYVLPGGTGSPLDPSQSLAGMSCNGGIDCTMPAPMGPGLPNFFAPRNKIPEEVTNNMHLEDWVNKDDLQKMPKTF